MKKTFLIALLSLGIMGCNAQAGKDKNNEIHFHREQNKPQTNTKVNKRFDDKGNLVEYDSTYTWSYSSKDGMNGGVNADSLLNAFRKQFDNGLPSLFSEGFGDPFTNDSTFFKNFMSPGSFMERWKGHDMEKMMMKTEHFKDLFLN